MASKIKKKPQFPYVVQAQYEHRTTADAHLQYHCAVHKNTVALINVANVPATGYRHQLAKRARRMLISEVKRFSIILVLVTN